MSTKVDELQKRVEAAHRMPDKRARTQARRDVMQDTADLIADMDARVGRLADSAFTDIEGSMYVRGHSIVDDATYTQCGDTYVNHSAMRDARALIEVRHAMERLDFEEARRLIDGLDDDVRAFIPRSVRRAFFASDTEQ